MKVKEKTIEEKYLSLSELDHVIMRSGMYIGSVKEEQKNMFIYDVDDAKIKLSEMSYTPGLLKLIDEVISNIADEYRRKDNMGLTHAELEFTRYILASSCAFAIYYVFKVLIIYTIDKRNYLKSLNDIKEIVKTQPIKKEATKKK